VIRVSIGSSDWWLCITSHFGTDRFAPGSTVASAASVWLFLVIVEWLADCFAGWLSRHWLAHLVRPPNDLGKMELMGMSQLPPVRPKQTPSSAANATSARKPFNANSSARGRRRTSGRGGGVPG